MPGQAHRLGPRAPHALATHHQFACPALKTGWESLTGINSRDCDPGGDLCTNSRGYQRTEIIGGSNVLTKPPFKHGPFGAPFKGLQHSLERDLLIASGVAVYGQTLFSGTRSGGSLKLGCPEFTFQNYHSRFQRNGGKKTLRCLDS